MFFRTASSLIEIISSLENEAKREAILFLLGGSDVSSTFAYQLANQNGWKVLFTYVVYTKFIFRIALKFYVSNNNNIYQEHHSLAILLFVIQEAPFLRHPRTSKTIRGHTAQDHNSRLIYSEVSTDPVHGSW